MANRNKSTAPTKADPGTGTTAKRGKGSNLLDD
jgi:hypothetical protein